MKMVVLLACSAAFVASAVFGQAPAKSLPHAELRAGQKTASAERQLAVTTKPLTGDFDAMLERHFIRVAAPYNRTIFYIEKGTERGIGVELVRDFERWLNKRWG